VLALRLEFGYSKKEILALYAANAPFGGNVVGLDAASWRYFGRSAQHLSWGEMATLAVLPNAPSLVHLGKNRQALLLKRNKLLQKLQEAGRISETDASLAMQEPLPNQPLALPQSAPHLLQLFKKENKELQLPTGIRTSIDGNLQKNVNQIIEQHHDVLKGNNINNICALVLDVASGEVLAYVGNIYQPQNKELVMLISYKRHAALAVRSNPYCMLPCSAMGCCYPICWCPIFPRRSVVMPHRISILAMMALFPQNLLWQGV
jgi:penicillin-binding protein 1C